MWELDHKKGWALKNWCFWTVVLEKTLEGPLGCNEIKPVNPKGNQSWIFIGRTEAETPTIWPPDAKNWLIGKDLMWGKTEGSLEKGMTEDKMVEWHHQFDGHEFDKTVGDTKGQGSLACCSPWGHRESGTTEWLNNNLQAFGITEEKRRSRKNIRNNDEDFSTLIIDTQAQTRKLRKYKQDKHRK